MKATGLGLLFLGWFVCGCGSTSTYQTSVWVNEAKEAGQYVVQAKVVEQISAWYGSGRRPMLVAPFVCEPGKECTGTTVSLDGKRTVTMRAYIPTKDEQIPARCHVSVRRGEQVLNDTYVVLLLRGK